MDLSLYLQLDGSRSYEEQRVAVPDVDVQGVKGQVTKEPALLFRLQETIIDSELHLQTWGTWTQTKELQTIQTQGLQPVQQQS